MPRIHRSAWFRVYLVLVILVLGVALLMVVRNFNSAEMASTPLPQSNTVTPLSTQQSDSEFDKAAQKYQINFSCSPVCFGQLEPNVSTLVAVNTWLSQVTASVDSPEGYQIAGSQSVGSFTLDDLTMIIVSGGDSVQPKARAFGVSAPYSLSTLGVKVVASEWTPQDLLAKYGSPNQISYTVESVSYRNFVLIDYKTWAIQYALVGVQGAEGVDTIGCEISAGTIWSFGANEDSALDMLRDLQKYPDNNLAKIPPPFIFTKIKTVTDSAEFSRQVESLKSTNCLAAGS